MFTTILLFVFFLFVNQINGRTFHSRQTDSLKILREKCTQNPYASECTQIQYQMEDLLRKCNDMITPVSACNDVKDKYCYIWPKQLYCYSSNGGGQVQPTQPPWNTDSSWYQVPSDSTELRSRADYCVNHQSEQKCVNFLSAIKVRYSECSTRPKTDTSCQSFKYTLCTAFPKFPPCLNNGSKRQISQLKHMLRMRRTVST